MKRFLHLLTEAVGVVFIALTAFVSGLLVGLGKQ